MGKQTGFLEYERTENREVPVRERITGYKEFHVQEPEEVYTRIDLRAAGPLSILAERARTPFRS